MTAEILILIMEKYSKYSTLFMESQGQDAGRWLSYGDTWQAFLCRYRVPSTMHTSLALWQWLLQRWYRDSSWNVCVWDGHAVPTVMLEARIAKIYPLDAMFDVPEDVPDDIKSNKRDTLMVETDVSHVAKTKLLRSRAKKVVESALHSVALFPSPDPRLCRCRRLHHWRVCGSRQEGLRQGSHCVFMTDVTYVVLLVEKQPKYSTNCHESGLHLAAWLCLQDWLLRWIFWCIPWQMAPKSPNLCLKLAGRRELHESGILVQT